MYEGAQTTAIEQLVQIGVCSLCNGAVMMPKYWSGTNQPTPTCSVCGAVEKPHYLRVIEMVQK